MKKKDVEVLKAKLIEAKQRISRHLEDISDSSVADLDAASGDSVDIAALEINQNSLQKIGKREMNHLKKIDVALAKIERNDDSYGECENCGEGIAVARLMARPEAQLCIDCKTEQENQERRYSDRAGQEEPEGFPEEADEL